MNEAFAYCWTDHLTNKLYVGWHKGQPDDGYVCSSKYMKEQYLKRANDFTRQIIAIGSSKDITKLETAILQSVDAKNDSQFYNLHNGDGFYRFGTLTEKHIEKLKGPKTEAHKKAMSLNHADFSGRNNPMYGRSAIKEKNLKWYTNGTDEIYITEGKQPEGWSSGRKIKGIKFPERTYEHRKKLSESAKGRPSNLKGHTYNKVKCPHCGTIGGGGNMTRSHFDNCRMKNGSN